jgi:hypothetical protein
MDDRKDKIQTSTLRIEQRHKHFSRIVDLTGRGGDAWEDVAVLTSILQFEGIPEAMTSGRMNWAVQDGPGRTLKLTLPNLRIILDQRIYHTVENMVQ